MFKRLKGFIMRRPHVLMLAVAVVAFFCGQPVAAIIVAAGALYEELRTTLLLNSMTATA